MPQPQTEAARTAPDAVTIGGAGAIAEAIAARIAAAGISLARKTNAAATDALLERTGAVLFLTDGRSATQRAHDTGISNSVLVDLALDYKTAKRLALCAAEQCTPQAYDAVVGLFQAAGYAVSRFDDVPSMAVMRTVAMLANEAADAVNQGVCTAQGADTAMLKGVNYPLGPLAWADIIGLSYVKTVLDNLATVYGEDRYRVSPLIQRKAWSGSSFTSKA